MYLISPPMDIRAASRCEGDCCRRIAANLLPARKHWPLQFVGTWVKCINYLNLCISKITMGKLRPNQQCSYETNWVKLLVICSREILKLFCWEIRIMLFSVLQKVFQWTINFLKGQNKTKKLKNKQCLYFANIFFLAKWSEVTIDEKINWQYFTTIRYRTEFQNL